MQICVIKYFSFHFRISSESSAQIMVFLPRTQKFMITTFVGILVGLHYFNSIPTGL